MRQKVMTETYCKKSTETGDTEDEQRERKEGELGFECKSLAKNPEAEEQKSKTNSKSSHDRTQKFQER